MLRCITSLGRRMRRVSALRSRGSRSLSKRVYADYNIYSDEGALSLSLSPPKFRDAGRYMTLQSPGLLIFQFAKGLKRDDGSRGFDWRGKKQTILNVRQAGEFLASPKLPLTFSYKRLSEETMLFEASEMTVNTVGKKNDGGYLFELKSKSLAEGEDASSVSDFDSTFSVPVSASELAILRAVIQYSLPYMLGWDRVVAGASQGQNTMPEFGTSGGRGDALPAQDIWGDSPM